MKNNQNPHIASYKNLYHIHLVFMIQILANYNFYHASCLSLQVRTAKQLVVYD